MADDRIQQLIDAGVASSSADLSADATALIKMLTDEEFNCLLSTRAKILAASGKAAQGEYDKFVCVII